MMKKNVLKILMILFVIPGCSSCDHINNALSTNELGNNLALMEGEKTKDRIIVYCTGRSAGYCYAGQPVIPSGRDTTTSYIEEAVANEKWVIASAFSKDKSRSYWIINKDFKINANECDTVNCDSIIQSHVIGPLQLTDFNKKRKSLKINLNFK
jgi:hypothetical protein